MEFIGITVVDRWIVGSLHGLPYQQRGHRTDKAA